MYYIIYRIDKADDGKPKWGIYMEGYDMPYVSTDLIEAKTTADSLVHFMRGCGYKVNTIVAESGRLDS